jgi:hypothetical protein
MKLAIFIVLCAVIAIGAARAQTFEEAKACVGDAFHFCKREASTLDMAAIRKCLVDHRSKISSECRNMLRKHGA